MPIDQDEMYEALPFEDTSITTNQEEETGSDDQGHGQATTPRKSCPAYPTVPTLFPRKSVNLMSFSPFDGALGFVLSQFDNYLSCFNFLGVDLIGPPERIGMVLCSAHPDEIRDLISSLDLPNLTKDSFPIIACPIPQGEPTTADTPTRSDEEDREEDKLPIELLYDLEFCRDGKPGPKFLLVESIYLLGPPGMLTDVHSIARLCRRLKRFCIRKDCTILGLAIMAKSKIGEHYEQLSHKIYGSVQWGASVNSLTSIIEQKNIPGLFRIVIQSNRFRLRSLTKWAKIDIDEDGQGTGRMELCQPPQELLFPARAKLDPFLDNIEPGEHFARALVIDWANDPSVAVPSKTVDRWLKGCVKSGVLVKSKGFTRTVEYWKPMMN